MAQPAIQFSLQPALDKAAHDRDVCADQVAEIQSLLSAARTHLADLQSKNLAAVQLARVEADNHCKAVSANGETGDLIDGARDLAVVNRAAADSAAAVVRQRQAIDLLVVRLDVKKEELLERMEQARAYEKLREKAVEAHAKARERADELEIDEQALEQFERRRQIDRKR